VTESDSSSRSVRRYHAVFRAAPDGILLVRSDGTIAEANPEALRLFGYPAGELIDRPVEVLVPEEARSRHQADRAGYGRDPQPRPMGIGFELQAVRRDGSRIPVEISLSPLDSPDGDLVIAIVRDLTERRRLKGFGAGALRAAEDERRRIARELHDETAQSLAGLLMRLKVLERRLGDHAAVEDVGRMREWLHDTMEGVRRIARGLRPPELEDVGLVAGLRRFVRERFPSTTVEFDFDGSEELLSPEQSLVAYRIAQEALGNAVRHGGARRVELVVRRHESGKGVWMAVTDDGQGFDPAAVEDPGAGLGLIGMEERAQLAGGHFEITSEPGKGTRAEVFLPVRGVGDDG